MSVRLIVLVGYIVIIECCLLYVNYVARVRYSKYFIEMSKLWRKYDENNRTILSLFLHFAFVFTMTIICYWLTFEPGLTFILGVTATNFVVDLKVVSYKRICMFKECERQEETATCVSCMKENREKYRVAFPSLKVKEVKKKCRK